MHQSVTQHRYTLLFLLLFMALKLGGVESIQATENSAVAKVPVIMYHTLCREEGGNFALTPEAFEQDLLFLQENGYHTVTAADLIAFVYEGTALPDKPILLTFDDGYYDNYVYALPLLAQYQMHMVLSVMGESTALWSEKDGEKDERYGHVTWDEVREMAESGYVEIGNHTYALHRQDKGRDGSTKNTDESEAQYREVLQSDVGLLQQLLADNSGVVPLCFAYPYGRVSRESIAVLREMGFLISFTTREGVNTITRGDKNSLFCLRRMNRAPSRSVADIVGKLERNGF